MTLQAPPDAALCDAVWGIAPIAEAVESALRVCCEPRVHARVLELAALLGVPNLVPVAALEDATIAEEIVARRFANVTPNAAGEPRVRRAPELVRRDDGTSLRAYASGSEDRPAILISPASGMPVELVDRWIEALAQTHFVMTWETRGLFAPLQPFDEARVDIATQAADLIAVMDFFDVPRAHVMAMCAGAIVAMEAAVLAPARMASLSLWHGSYYGMDCGRTTHEDDMYELLCMASRSRDDAEAIQFLMGRSAVTRTLPDDEAPLVLYPYVTPELLYRYALLTRPVMEYDARRAAQAISVPIDVIASADDTTVDAGASRCIADTAAGGRLHLLSSGDHLSLFSAPLELQRLMSEILARSGA